MQQCNWGTLRLRSITFPTLNYHDTLHCIFPHKKTDYQLCLLHTTTHLSPFLSSSLGSSQVCATEFKQVAVEKKQEQLNCLVHLFIKVKQQRVYFKVGEKSTDSGERGKNRTKTFQRPGHHSNNCQVTVAP